MVHVTALTEGHEVAAGVVGRVVVPVCGCQNDPGHAKKAQILEGGNHGERTPRPAAPASDRRVPPAPIPEIVIERLCGRPQPSQLPPARRKQIVAESWGQPRGQKKRCACRIGMAGDDFPADSQPITSIVTPSPSDNALQARSVVNATALDCRAKVRQAQSPSESS